MSELVPEWRIGDLLLTDYPFAIPFGTDYGSPDASPEVLASFLTDGDLELTARRGNRTLTLPVLIEYADMAAAAQAELDLVAECDKALNTLYVDPGDGYGEPFQFTMFRGTVTFQRDDDYERAGYRLFEVVWRALPWPEATTEIVAAVASSDSVGTAKQRIGAFPTVGSVASRGSLSIEHETTALGELLVYTCADPSPESTDPGYVPANRGNMVFDVPVADAAAVSGAHDVLNSGTARSGATYIVSADTLPSADYAVVVRARVADVGQSCDVSFACAPQYDGSNVGLGSTGPVVNIPYSAAFHFYNLGMARLPGAELPESALSTVTVSVSTPSAFNLHLDEMYLFDLSHGRLSRYNCGQGSPNPGVSTNRLWIDSPAVENDGLGRYLTGTEADRSDAYSALTWASAYGHVVFPAVHDFPVGGVRVFTVADGPATAVSVAYRYRPAGHSSVYSGT